MGYDANDEKQVKKARKQAEFDHALKLDVIRSVMGSAPGRIWAYSILERCHCFSTSFIAGAPDASAFREGERNIGLQFLADIQEATPDLYLTMIQEAKSNPS
jgi:hypothetical protein